jgi:hypothetical protein
MRSIHNVSYPVAVKKLYDGLMKCTCMYVCNALKTAVWFGLFVNPFSHIRNIGHVNYRLQSMLRGPFVFDVLDRGVH